MSQLYSRRERVMQFPDSKSVKQQHVSMADYDIQIRHVFCDMEIVYMTGRIISRDASLPMCICK